ncbi:MULTISPECIES: hypothetical protein [unclassified Bradyrhizobium]
MLALGIIIPILPKLIEGFVDNDIANAARIRGALGFAMFGAATHALTTQLVAADQQASCRARRRARRACPS